MNCTVFLHLEAEAKCSSVQEFSVTVDVWRFRRHIRDNRYSVFPNSGHFSEVVTTNLFIPILNCINYVFHERDYIILNFKI